jgi:DNA-directed RNA polymerase specialized sigma24 family protein
MRSGGTALAASRRVPAVSHAGGREAVARALGRCAARDRVLLALLLFEHLTPDEAASVIGVPAPRIERAYAALLGELRQALRGRNRRSSTPRFATPAARLRRAS